MPGARGLGLHTPVLSHRSLAKQSCVSLVPYTCKPQWPVGNTPTRGDEHCGGAAGFELGALFLSAVSVRKPAVASVPRGPRPFSLPTASDHGPGRDVRWTAKAVPRCQPGTPEPPPAIRSGLGGPPTSPRSGSRVAEQRGLPAGRPALSVPWQTPKYVYFSSWPSPAHFQRQWNSRGFQSSY